MAEVLIGIGTGIALTLLWILPMPMVLKRIQSAYIGVPKSDDLSPFMRRVTRALSQGLMLEIVIILKLLPVGAFFVVGIMRGSADFTVAACLAYLAIVTVWGMMSKIGGGKAARLADQLLEDALQQLGRHAGPGEYIETIGSVGHKLAGTPVFETAMDVLIRMGTVEARDVIEKVVRRIPSFGEEEENVYLERIDLVMSKEPALSTKKMPVFLKEYNFLKRTAVTKSGAEKEELEEKMAEIKVIIEEIVLSQTKIQQLFPDLFCLKCNAGVKMSGRGWKNYLHCVRCHDVVDLQVGIEHVVGKIGPFPERTLENGELCLNLWNPSTQKSKYVEFDDLVIAEGANIDYNWAISAMVQEMEKYFSEYAYAFGIEIVGNPDLDDNSIKMLREIGYKG